MKDYSRWYVDKKLGGKKTITVKGETYDWNPVYRTYNSRKQNELLKWSDLDVK